MLKIVATSGFAMFSMFFGSGNLVFPLLLGTHTLDKWQYALFGFLITAVCVPFLGLISMIPFEGHRDKFFNSLSAPVGFVMTLIMLLLIGPVGVIPRCINVAFGGVQLVWPNMSLSLFSFLFCTTLGVLVWRPNNVINIIGVVLTPLKLGGIALLILCGLWFAPDVPAYDLGAAPAFLEGVSVGYQTLDLIAAFFFSAAIVQYLKQHLRAPNPSTLVKASFAASCIGGVLLMLVYSGFVKLGASFAPHLTNASPEALLAAIGGLTLGHHALLIVSLTLAVSCLATAVILANLFIDFVRHDVLLTRLQTRASHESVTVVTLGVTFALSLLGFDVICRLLGSILVFMYPAFIALALYHTLRMVRPSLNCAKVVFWSVVALSAFFKMAAYIL